MTKAYKLENFDLVSRERDRFMLAINLDDQLAALFGDPSTADASEVEGVCEEANGSADLVQLAYDLAVRAAQQYRLAGKPVPPHVEAAMAQMKKSSTLEGA